MKTDRELLELAAKAAGNPQGTSRAYGSQGGLRMENGLYWNPLTDDGDAFRLAVKLELQLDLRHSRNTVLVYGSARIEEGAKEPYAATRRAIVRAAAAMQEALDGK
jgi:hypothetical protein